MQAPHEPMQTDFLMQGQLRTSPGHSEFIGLPVWYGLKDLYHRMWTGPSHLPVSLKELPTSVVCIVFNSNRYYSQSRSDLGSRWSLHEAQVHSVRVRRPMRRCWLLLWTHLRFGRQCLSLTVRTKTKDLRIPSGARVPLELCHHCSVPGGLWIRAGQLRLRFGQQVLSLWMSDATRKLRQTHVRGADETVPGHIHVQGLCADLLAGVWARLRYRWKNVLERVLPEHRKLSIAKLGASTVLRCLRTTRGAVAQLFILETAEEEVSNFKLHQNIWYIDIYIYIHFHTDHQHALDIHHQVLLTS